MKNTKVLMVAFLLVGSILAGCDDGGNSDVATMGDSGHPDTQPGSSITDTSPVGGVNPACSTPNAVVVSFVAGQSPQASKATLVAAVQSLCVGWTGQKDSYRSNAGYVCETNYQTIYGLTPATSVIECRTPLTTVECSNVAHNFVDTAGVMHGLILSRGTDGLWTLGGFGVLLRTDAIPACTTDGTLLGLLTSSKG